MNGEMTRDEALKHVKNYDGEFPNKNFKEVIKYLDLTEFDFEEIVSIEIKKFGSKKIIIGS